MKRFWWNRKFHPQQEEALKSFLCPHSCNSGTLQRGKMDLFQNSRSPGLAFKIAVQNFPECTAPHPALLLAKILPWIWQNPWNLCNPSWDLVLRMLGFSSGDQEGQLRSFQSILFILIQFDSFFFHFLKAQRVKGEKQHHKSGIPGVSFFLFFFPLFLNFILIFFFNIPSTDAHKGTRPGEGGREGICTTLEAFGAVENFGALLFFLSFCQVFYFSNRS